MSYENNTHVFITYHRLLTEIFKVKEKEKAGKTFQIKQFFYLEKYFFILLLDFQSVKSGTVHELYYVPGQI